jgi:biopolymer transport protein ExbD
MEINRLRALVAAPMASLLLVLSLCAFVVERSGSVGMRVPMIRIPDKSKNDCSDPNRSVFLQLSQNGSYWINLTEIPSDRLTATVAYVMENRSERILYVVADPQVCYGQFTDFLDKIAGTKMVLPVALLTDQLRKEIEGSRGRAYCEIEWPENEDFSSPVGIGAAPHL